MFAPLPPLLAFSEPAASGIRPLRASLLASGGWLAPAMVAAPGPFTTAGGALHGKVARTRPDRARQVVLFQEDDGGNRDALHAVFWDGTRWDDGTGEPWGDAKALGSIGTTGMASRNFDAAYEQKSGELLVVAGVNTHVTVKYWLHGGTAWNTTPLLRSVLNTAQDPANVFDWVRLAPMPATNRIAFLGVANDPVNKDSAAVEAMVWDGDTNTWGSFYVLSFPNGQTYHSTEAIDLKFTLAGTNAGEALAVWGNGQKVYASTWRAGAVWSAPRVAVDLGSGATVRWLRLAADPGSDDMVLAIGDVEGSTGRITTVPYDGETRTWGNLSPAHVVGAFGDLRLNRPFDVAWDPAAGPRGALLVFADAEGLWSARSLDGGASFDSPSRVPGAAPAWWVQLERQPDGVVQLAVQDAADDLRGWSWNGSSWASTTASAVSSNLETGGSHAVEPFALAGLVVAGRLAPPPTDIDGDGRADLLWQNQSTGALSVWFLQDAAVRRTTALRPESFADPQWRICGFGDFDRDGSTDVLWHHRGTRELYAWLLEQAVPVGGAHLSPATAPFPGWEVRGTADFDGDGGPDILWNDPATRELHVWLMDGLRMRRSVKLGLTSSQTRAGRSGASPT